MTTKNTTKTFHHLTVEETLSALNTSAKGLDDREVESRRAEYGFNEIPDATVKSWIVILAKQFKSLLVWVQVVAMAISLIWGHAVDAWIIGVVILINAAIGFVQEFKAERAVHALKSMMTHKAKVLRNGEKQNIEARELVPGDIIILEEGDSIPADARLIESGNLRAIEAPLTGESVPVEKRLSKVPEDTPLADQHNMLRKSTFIAGGYAQAVVTGTGMNTAIGEIAKTLGNIKTPLSNFQRKTNMLARQMAVIAGTSALALFLVNYFFQDISLDEILVIAIAALVSSIPEGLPAVLAIVLAIGANRMSKRNAIVRDFNATETLGAVTTIITDKTGTLTQNTLTVGHVHVPGVEDFTVTGEGWRPIGHFLHGEHVVETESHPQLQQLLQICANCNNSEIQHQKEKDSYHLVGDPTEGALLVLARKAGLTSGKNSGSQRIADMPFNSDIKMRATLVERDGLRQLLVVGAPEQVLSQCAQVVTKGQSQALDQSQEDAIRSKIEDWSGDAMRVIALAYKTVDSDYSEIDPEDITDLTFSGIVGMIDPPRPEVKEAVAACKKKRESA
jgi:Ca2+-transporting ATPase